jgi:hypothetical protein
MESAAQADPDAGPKAFRRLRAAAVNDALGRHLNALDAAVAANTTLARDTAKGAEAAAHLAELRDRARWLQISWSERRLLPKGYDARQGQAPNRTLAIVPRASLQIVSPVAVI